MILCKVVRKDKSPMNPKVWVLQLECGHDLYITGRTKTQYMCNRCALKAMESPQMTITKTDLLKFIFDFIWEDPDITMGAKIPHPSDASRTMHDIRKAIGKRFPELGDIKVQTVNAELLAACKEAHEFLGSDGATLVIGGILRTAIQNAEREGV